MNLLKRFFTTMTRSISDMRFYAEVAREKTMGRPLGYLYFLCVVLSLVTLIPAAVKVEQTIPVTRSFIHSQRDVVRQWYPEELVLTFHNGEVTANVEQPYFLELPMEWREHTVGAGFGRFDHFLTIDTEADAGDFVGYNTAILLTKNSLIVADSNGQYRVQTFEKELFAGDDKLVLTRGVYQMGVDNAWGILEHLPAFLHILTVVLILIAPWIIALVVTGFLLLLLLVHTVILLLIARIAKRPLPYGTLYRLGCFGLTLPLLYNVLQGIVGFYIPFLFTGIFLIWMTAVITHLPKTLHAPFPVISAKAPKKPTRLRRQASPRHEKTSKRTRLP